MKNIRVVEENVKCINSIDGCISVYISGPEIDEHENLQIDWTGDSDLVRITKNYDALPKDIQIPNKLNGARLSTRLEVSLSNNTPRQEPISTRVNIQLKDGDMILDEAPVVVYN
jgi:hypothetical protein